VSAVDRIKESYATLKPGQKKVADYFLETDLSGMGSSIDEIASRIGTSAASISRFCKRLGYDNFGQFKLAMSQVKTYEPDSVLPIFMPTDDADRCIHKAFSEGVTNLKDTERRLNYEAIKLLVDRIVAGGRLFLFGSGGSGAVGKLGEILFSQLGFSAHHLSDAYQMMLGSGHARKGDVVIGISHTGTTRSVVESVRVAAERGAVTAALTNYRDSPLARAASILLETACYEGRVHFAQSNSVVAQIVILNSMYLLAASRIGEDVIREVDHIEKICRTNLRLKS